MDVSILVRRNGPRRELATILAKKGYDYIGPIGRGGTSNCFAVKSVKYSSIFVCKQIYLANDHICSDCEINALKQLSSPGVISLYDYTIEHPYVYIFLEYCPRGSLHDYIVKNGPLTNNLLIAVCRNLLAGLVYIHDKKYAHMDIKLSNILIDRYGRTKLADFGMARAFLHDAESEYKSGTASYMSPEILTKAKYDPFKADIWSLGITFYVLATGRSPWVSQTREDLINEIIAGGITILPYIIPSQLRNLISSMCSMDPQKRPTAQQLLSSAIFKGIDPKEGYIPENTGIPLAKTNRLAKSGHHRTHEVTLKQLTSQPRFNIRKKGESHMRKVASYRTQPDSLLPTQV